MVRFGLVSSAVCESSSNKIDGNDEGASDVLQRIMFEKFHLCYCIFSSFFVSRGQIQRVKKGKVYYVLVNFTVQKKMNKEIGKSSY